MKSSIKDWLKVLILLLDEAVVVVVVFLILWFLKVEIPLPLIIFLALVAGVLAFFIHKAVIPTFHKKQITGAEGLIGTEGEVTESLTPVGVVRIKDEYWKAKSVGENIAVGEEVEIVKVSGLTLVVKRKGQSLG